MNYEPLPVTEIEENKTSEKNLMFHARHVKVLTHQVEMSRKQLNICVQSSEEGPKLMIQILGLKI